jgi:predicted amidophosphoribosyltransferase
LFYALLAILAAMWMRRLSASAQRSGGPASKGQTFAKGMPRQLVCGACGKDYEPLKQGWLCPHCQN